MPDKSAKLPENVPGKFYVDNQCIDCDACRATAPDNFYATKNTDTPMSRSNRES